MQTPFVDRRDAHVITRNQATAGCSPGDSNGRSSMFKRIPNPFIGTFSDSVSVETGDYTTIHVSGQVGNDATGKVTAKSFEEEAALCLANVAKVLERSAPA